MAEFRARERVFSGPKAALISPLTILWLRWSGQVDGQNGQPAPGADGTWTSPFVARLINKCRDYESRQWLFCRQQTAPLYLTLKRNLDMVRDARANEDRAASEVSASAMSPEDAATVRPGEEGLDPRIAERRRRREHAGQTAGLRQARSDAAARVQQLNSEVAELAARISEHEAFARLRSHRYVDITNRKIAIYWRTAISGRPIPAPTPSPPVATATGEDAYRRHLPTHTEREYSNEA